MITETTEERTTLYFRQGSSDKVYHVAIEPSGPGYIVTFAFGRRGSTLQTGTKTPGPLDYREAKKIFDKQVKQKVAKGYTPGEEGTPYQQSSKEDRVTGLHPQLLNPIDITQADRLIGDEEWWAQEKLDGRRILIRKSGPTVEGINRSGLVVALPATIADALRGMQAARSCILDGEAVGDVYHIFDCLERDGRDLRIQSYAHRYAAAVDLAEGCISNQVRYAPVATTTAAKLAMFHQLRQDNREGIVFKQHAAPYTTGRPASGGPQLKLKFTTTCSCIVAGPNGTRHSVRLVMLDDSGHRIGVGNVTVPVKHVLPMPGEVVEVRYLYAYAGGGLCQPVYLGRRDDIRQSACRLGQLKLKRESDGDNDDDEAE